MTEIIKNIEISSLVPLKIIRLRKESEQSKKNFLKA